RQDADGRTGGHGRHVQAAQAHHARGGRQRRSLPVHVVDSGRITFWEEHMAGKDFVALKQTIEQKFMGHPIVTHNAYTKWFSRGEISPEQLRQFTVQFSVFSNQFLLAALNRVINADTLESSRESKEILMNELGVVYNKVRKGTSISGTPAGS